MNYSENKAALRQNLIDAGCDEKQADKFVNSIQNKEFGFCFKELSKHRRCLIDSMHKSQKCIDCLDYLVYMLEKENRYE
ncbi:MAG: hypothetical protein K2H13_09885 [Eubacterium sp.]|nr:hypothetical protein [Eubacterium sp.]